MIREFIISFIYICFLVILFFYFLCNIFVGFKVSKYLIVGIFFIIVIVNIRVIFIGIIIIVGLIYDENIVFLIICVNFILVIYLNILLNIFVRIILVNISKIIFLFVLFIVLIKLIFWFFLIIEVVIKLEILRVEVKEFKI